MLRLGPAPKRSVGPACYIRGQPPNVTYWWRRALSGSIFIMKRPRSMWRELPSTYVAFDLLFDGYTPVMDRPLAERRPESFLPLLSVILKTLCS